MRFNSAVIEHSYSLVVCEAQGPQEELSVISKSLDLHYGKR